MILPSSTAAQSPSTSSPSEEAAAAPEICEECESKDSWVIHTVRHLGIVKSLCTHCLLRNYPSSFCPICFFFYDSSPPHTSRRITCSKCISITHSQCATESNSSSYLCPPCRSPETFSFFRPIIGADGDRFVDLSLSRVFLCASKIAVQSMNKAVHSVKSDAERRAKEAALARKRSREKLEEVLALEGKEKASSVGGVGVGKVKEVVVEQKPKVVSVENNGGGSEKKEQSQSVELAKVKQEGGGDANK